MEIVFFEKYESILFRGSETSSHLWIGLQDVDGDGQCTCSLAPYRECIECRVRFTWIDETPVNEQFSAWQGSEPGRGEKCVRLTNRRTFTIDNKDLIPLWSGSNCSTSINYACSEGS